MDAEDINQRDVQEIIDKIPKDLHHLTLDTILPMITVLMAHVQEVKNLDGPSKKKMVLYCLDFLIKRMPSPESQVLAPVVHAIAPAAIEGIMQGSRYAEKHCDQLLIAQRVRTQLPALLTKVTWPSLRSPSKRLSPPKTISLMTKPSVSFKHTHRPSIPRRVESIATSHMRCASSLM